MLDVELWPSPCKICKEVPMAFKIANDGLYWYVGCKNLSCSRCCTKASHSSESMPLTNPLRGTTRDEVVILWNKMQEA